MLTMLTKPMQQYQQVLICPVVTGSVFKWYTNEINFRRRLDSGRRRIGGFADDDRI